MSRGLILCGGHGTRLRPATLAMNKHMVPILNEPMVLYPLRTLKSLGVTDIMIVSGGDHVGDFTNFLGSGKDYGVNLTYRVQDEAGGIAQAIGLAEDFAIDGSFSVILGDNIFGGVPDNRPVPKSVQIYLSAVKDPRRFGCPSFKENGYIDMIEEKPKNPKSNYAVTGLYTFPMDVFDVIKDLKPSARGELEVTDIINHYIEKDDVLYHIHEGFWSDCGQVDSLYQTIKWKYENDHGGAT